MFALILRKPSLVSGVLIYILYNKRKDIYLCIKLSFHSILIVLYNQHRDMAEDCAIKGSIISGSVKNTTSLKNPNYLDAILAHLQSRRLILFKAELFTNELNANSDFNNCSMNYVFQNLRTRFRTSILQLSYFLLSHVE